MLVYDLLTTLINKKYYANKQNIIDLLNNYVAFMQVTIEQYTELMLLTEDVYRIITEEEVIK